MGCVCVKSSPVDNDRTLVNLDTSKSNVLGGNQSSNDYSSSTGGPTIAEGGGGGGSNQFETSGSGAAVVSPRSDDGGNGNHNNTFPKLLSKEGSGNQSLSENNTITQQHAMSAPDMIPGTVPEDARTTPARTSSNHLCQTSSSSVTPQSLTISPLIVPLEGGSSSNNSSSGGGGGEGGIIQVISSSFPLQGDTSTGGVDSGFHENSGPVSTTLSGSLSMRPNGLPYSESMRVTSMSMANITMASPSSNLLVPPHNSMTHNNNNSNSLPLHDVQPPSNSTNDLTNARKAIEVKLRQLRRWLDGIAPEPVPSVSGSVGGHGAEVNFTERMIHENLDMLETLQRQQNPRASPSTPHSTLVRTPQGGQRGPGGQNPLSPAMSTMRNVDRKNRSLRSGNIF
eukprot:PhF_6_TR16956/c1_g1_i6/m.25581